MNKTLATIKQIGADIERKHLPIAAAGAAYYLLMSIFPALVALAAVLTYLPLENGMPRAVSLLAFVIPQQGLPFIEHVLSTTSPRRTGLLSFGLIMTLWVASMAFKGIILGLDMVYDAYPPRPLWITRILAFGLTLAVGLLLLLGVVLTLAGPVLEVAFSSLAPVQSLWTTILPYVHWFLVVSLTFAAIELLYLVGPSMPAANRLTIPGALFATAGWVALAWGFGFYLHHFGELKLGTFFGILAMPVACMLWCNLSAAVILLGAEANSWLDETFGKSGIQKLFTRVRGVGQKRD